MSGARGKDTRRRGAVWQDIHTRRHIRWRNLMSPARHPCDPPEPHDAPAERSRPRFLLVCLCFGIRFGAPAFCLDELRAEKTCGGKRSSARPMWVRAQALACARGRAPTDHAREHSPRAVRRRLQSHACAFRGWSESHCLVTLLWVLSCALLFHFLALNSAACTAAVATMWGSGAGQLPCSL